MCFTRSLKSWSWKRVHQPNRIWQPRNVSNKIRRWSRYERNSVASANITLRKSVCTHVTSVSVAWILPQWSYATSSLWYSAGLMVPLNLKPLQLTDISFFADIQHSCNVVRHLRVAWRLLLDVVFVQKGGPPPVRQPLTEFLDHYAIRELCHQPVHIRCRSNDMPSKSEDALHRPTHQHNCFISKQR